MPAEKMKPAENSFFRFLQEALARAGSNVDDAYRQMYEPVLGAIEPDADQYGGPSDMDADNMAVGGLAGRMGGGDFGRLGRGAGYVGEAPTSGPYAGLSGRAPAPQMQRPGGTAFPPSPPTDMVRAGPSAMVGPPAPPPPPRPTTPLGPGYSMVPRAASGMVPTDTGYAPMTRTPAAPMGRPIGPMGPFGPFPSRVDVTPPVPNMAGRTGNAAGLGFAGAAAPVLAAAMIERALAAKDSLDARIARGQSTMPGYQPAGAVEVRVGPRDAGRYSYMPPVNPPAPAPMARVSAGAPVSPALTPMRMPPAMAVTPTPDATDYRSAYAPTPMSPRMGDFSDEVRQLGMNRSADAALAPFLTDEADPMIEALMQRISARQARGGV